MKKALTLILIISLFVLPVCARSGDVAGGIYSTDIKAFINGVEVPSYCIDGKTVIIPEDITHCIWNGNSRSLQILDFYPFQVETHVKNLPVTNSTLPVGQKIGNIYETDITTYLAGRKIKAYALDGKVAVAIEDIGCDREFSPYGGKYLWDNETRTINLEFIYSNGSLLRDLLINGNMSMTVTKTGEITFAPEMGFGTITSEFYNQQTLQLFPITYNGETVGYSYVSELHGSRHTAIDYFFIERLSEIIPSVTVEQPTREEWLQFCENQMYTIIDSFETDDYIFLYMYQPGPHGSTELLHRINSKGYRIQYEKKFTSVSFHGQKHFDNVVIDKENRKVTFRYDVNYEIDLDSGVILPVS